VGRVLNGLVEKAGVARADDFTEIAFEGAAPVGRDRADAGDGRPWRDGDGGVGRLALWQTRPDVLIASLAPAAALLKDRFAAAQRRPRRGRP
jgi:hypothetical protein